jgi:hypothetical protein
MKRSIFTVLLGASLFLAVTPALAGKGGIHSNDPAQPTCLATGGLVQATGLPQDQVINFMMSDASGTTGWVLGTTTDGSWSVNVPASSGATMYAFVSRTWGANGSKYTTFATCSA